MNIQNMKRLLTRLKHIKDERFDMSDFIQPNECGTAACIAGHACLIMGFKIGPHPDFEGELIFVNKKGRKIIPESEAGQWLGLDYREADNLFFGRWSPKFLSASKAEAIAHLEKMLNEATAYEEAGQ